MKIAVASQNKKHVTEHAGRCRKFWVFSVEGKKIVDRQLLELPKEQAFHESSPHADHPLDDIEILISGGMGQGLMRRLEKKGIASLVTTEDDPELAVSLCLRGSLVSEKPRRQCHGHDER